MSLGYQRDQSIYNLIQLLILHCRKPLSQPLD